MVCLEGLTFDAVANTLTPAELKQFPLWNWVIHKLIKYMHRFHKHYHLPFNGECMSPCIPDHRDAYGAWFEDVYRELSKHFDDASYKLVLDVCLNVPTEEVALIIYNATSLDNQKGFLTFLKTMELESVFEDNLAPVPYHMPENETPDNATPFVNLFDPELVDFILPPPAPKESPPLFAEPLMPASPAIYGLDPPLPPPTNKIIAPKCYICKPEIPLLEPGFYSQIFKDDFELPSAANLPMPTLNLLGHMAPTSVGQN